MSEIGGNVIQESIVLEGLGNLFESKGDFKKSIEYFKLAGEIYYKFGDDFNYAELKYKIAQILLKFDQLESIKNFEEALDLFKDLNYIKRVAEILHKLGDIYVNRQIVELAISYFQQAKDFFMDLKDDFNVKLINEKIHSLDDSSTNYNWFIDKLIYFFFLNAIFVSIHSREPIPWKNLCHKKIKNPKIIM